MNFKEYIGHKNQINRLELLFNNDSIPQTILFSGISGIGKKGIGVNFLKAIFCNASNPPCCSCPSCIQIDKASYPDMIEISPNKKGIIPIGDPNIKEQGSVRWLIDRLAKKSISGKYGVLIEGIDKMKDEAQNALLKAIEEPPVGTIIIIVTANKSKIIPTILSRCFEISFYPLQNSELKEIIKSKIDCDEDKLNLISEISGGSVEISLILNDDDIFNDILDLCKGISDNINENDMLFFDFKRIKNKIQTEKLLNILINIYRVMLTANINKSSFFPFLDSIEIHDIIKIRKLIKILLSLKKGLSNNINFMNSLKGMIYSIDNIDEAGVPDLDFSFSR